MHKRKRNMWLTKPWVPGIFIFIPLACFCLYTAWALNDDRTLKSVIPIGLTALVFCTAGIFLLMYVRKIPGFVQDMVLERTVELEKSEKRNKTIVDALPDMVFIVDRN